jgi:AcrR family transcriptional regulator
VPKVSQERLEARKDEILAAAQRCFARYGYAGATVARLEEETGLSRGAIFNYFESKWDIFRQLTRRENTRLIRLALEHGFDAVARWVETADPDWLGVYVETWQQVRTNPKLLEQAMRREPEAEQFLDWVRGEQQAGRIRGDVDAVEIARFMSLVLDGLALRRSFGLPLDVRPLLELVHGGIDAKPRRPS